MDMTQNISIIGAGNIAHAILQSLAHLSYPSERICVSNPHPEKLADCRAQFGVNVTQQNLECIAHADWIILAVKPQIIPVVLTEIRAHIGRARILSVAAGISLATLIQHLGGSPKCVRAMPNTPLAIGYGATALFANDAVDAPSREFADALFARAGLTCWLTDEALMDVATAVSGSGPAFLFYYIEHMISAAIKQGLVRDIAEKLVKQTVLGSAMQAMQSNEDVSVLRARVTSPGGTTAAGIAAFDAQHFELMIDDVIARAVARAKALGETQLN